MPQAQAVTSGRSFTWNFYSKAGLEARQGDDSFPRGFLGRVVAGVCYRSLGCCQHPPVKSAPMGALAAMADPSGASPALHPLARQGGEAPYGSCSPAQHSSTSRMLPGTRSCCVALCACFPMIKVESSGWQVLVLSSASCKAYLLSAQVCPPLRERPQIPGTLNRAEHPSGCPTALDPASACSSSPVGCLHSSSRSKARSRGASSET